MLYGTVEYGSIAGGSEGKDWAARELLFTIDDEQLAVSAYDQQRDRPLYAKIEPCFCDLSRQLLGSVKA